MGDNWKKCTRNRATWWIPKFQMQRLTYYELGINTTKAMKIGKMQEDRIALSLRNSVTKSAGLP